MLAPSGGRDIEYKIPPGGRAVLLHRSDVHPGEELHLHGSSTWTTMLTTVFISTYYSLLELQNVRISEPGILKTRRGRPR